MPIRVAYNERSNMGGGLLEALFGGGQSGDYQSPRYEQRYQQMVRSTLVLSITDLVTSLAHKKAF